MTTRKRLLIAGSVLLIPACLLAVYAAATRLNPNLDREVGEKIDELNGVAIYYNGGVNMTRGRNLSVDGYNLGIRHQCVEFVKRYYFERHGHRMPDTFGHARDFFRRDVDDGAINAQRAMLQFSNGSNTMPEPADLLVFKPWLFNPYGHVAIVSSVDGALMEIAQQNPGPFGSSRETIPVSFKHGKWFVEHPRVLGWLRLPPVEESSSSLE